MNHQVYTYIWIEQGFALHFNFFIYFSHLISVCFGIRWFILRCFCNIFRSFSIIFCLSLSHSLCRFLSFLSTLAQLRSYIFLSIDFSFHQRIKAIHRFPLLLSYFFSWIVPMKIVCVQTFLWCFHSSINIIRASFQGQKI